MFHHSTNFYNLNILAYNSELKNLDYICLEGQTFEGDQYAIYSQDTTITDSSVFTLHAKENTKIGNITADRIEVEDHVQMIGDITVSNRLGGWSTLDANGYRITLDLTNRKITALSVYGDNYIVITSNKKKNHYIPRC